MKNYDFDKITDRKGTNALKLELLEKLYGDKNLLPMWVADMEFETPSFITDALKKRLEHSLFGYTLPDDNYWQSIINWTASHHDWNIKREWITYIPGIVKGIALAINLFLKPGDKVIIQPPVYHPFRLVPESNGLHIVNNPLHRNSDGTYSMDFENLEAITDDKCRMLILSNPHNPAGIVWEKETLKKLAHFCHSHGIIVISDEIHCDMTLWGNRHTPFATVSDEAAACSITFAAPSKTFNIAGIVSSYAIVPDENLRKKFYGWLEANELNHAPLFAPIATRAAFDNGEEWRKEMLEYVENNIEFVMEFCKEHITSIKPLRPQASFLIWLDCTQLGLNHKQLTEFFVKKARLALNDGEMFGQGGEGFMRMNIAMPICLLRQAMEQLRAAINEYII